MEGLKPEWTVKAIIVILLTSILFRCVSAVSHTVGGSFGWDLSADLQAWTSNSTFRVGDFLAFSYTPVHDVLEVNEVNFNHCHTLNPIKAYNSGETVVKLNLTGFRYFICGRDGHCEMGLKLRVRVLPQQLFGNQTSSPSTSSSNSNATHENSGNGAQPQSRRYRPRPRFPPTSDPNNPIDPGNKTNGSNSETGAGNRGSVDLIFHLALGCVAISLILS